MPDTALKTRLEAAARTLSRLPRSHMDRPGRSQSGWPDMQRTARLLVSCTRTPSPARPSPQAIDDMYCILEALYTLSPAARKLLWARACGLPWAQLQLRFGGSRTHLNRRYRLALAALSARLDGPASVAAAGLPVPVRALAATWPNLGRPANPPHRSNQKKMQKKEKKPVDKWHKIG